MPSKILTSLIIEWKTRKQSYKLYEKFVSNVKYNVVKEGQGKTQ